LKSWDILKALFSNAGLYKRKLLLFLIFAVVGITVGYTWQKSRGVEASVEFTPPSGGYFNEISMDVTVKENGDVFIEGKKNNKAITFYDNYDEIKIIVFSEPGYFIENFQGMINLPSGNAKDVRQIVYAVHGVGSYETSAPNPQTLFYEVREISPQAVVTIVADLPKGMVNPNKSQELLFKIRQLPLKNWFYVGMILPLVAIILMTVMIFKRRSAQLLFVRETLSEPPSNDPPAVAGVVVSGAVDAREIAATLVDLARRGFILIVNKGNGEFSFGKRRAGDLKKLATLMPFEKVLLDKIFLTPAYKSSLGDVEMRIGRHIFSRKIAQFYLGVYNFATQKGYFVKNPAKVHLAYKYTGFAFLFLSLVGFALNALTGADPKFSLIFWVGGMVAAYFIIRLSPFMPARSKLGTIELRKWLAFRKYLVSKKPLLAKDVLQSGFEQYLPLAIVLGVEVDWAKRFFKERFATPEWYESAEDVVTLDSFMGEFLPFLGFVAQNLARSHEPTVE